MKKIKIDKLLTDRKALFLDYDHGLEHGPIDFNVNNIDPNYLFHIAVYGKYNGVVLQKGIAERYIENYTKKVPLILKLNGKTNIYRGFPIARQTCSVKKAVDLGAEAIGYTIYVGSPLEPDIFKEFGKIQEQAHDYGLPVVAWMYPMGRYITNELSTSTLAYASRIGLELGADMINMKYNNELEEYKWIVKCAGNTKVIVSGGIKLPDKDFLKKVFDVMQTGAIGMTIGRGIWQHEEPMKMTVALKSIIFDNADVSEAMKYLE